MLTGDASLFEDTLTVAPFKTQLLKWIGNKQRFAHEIASHFPAHFGTYYEPFLGSGAVLGTIAPQRAVGSDVFKPLVQIWRSLSSSPDQLKKWYRERWALIAEIGKQQAYDKVLESFNASPNGADLLFLCRSCYGGVVRFRKADGAMSTPCGVHTPIDPVSFNSRVDVWVKRTRGARFEERDFEAAMSSAVKGDVVYCDPPYSDTQSILYGAQEFSLQRLFETIANCKRRGVYVALSIDGSKKSGDRKCELEIPDGVFEREVFVKCGRSMLRRFQMDGLTLETEHVADRLLLTY